MTGLPPAERKGGSRTPRSLLVYSVGVVAVLAGDVLPWLRSDQALWAWDLSALWAFTGSRGLLGLPPSVGFVVLAAGLMTAAPLMTRRPVSTTLSSGLSGLVLALAALVAFQSRGTDGLGTPGTGLVLSALGAAMVAAGALMQHEEDPPVGSEGAGAGA